MMEQLSEDAYDEILDTSTKIKVNSLIGFGINDYNSELIPVDDIQVRAVNHYNVEKLDSGHFDNFNFDNLQPIEEIQVQDLELRHIHSDDSSIIFIPIDKIQVLPIDLQINSNDKHDEPAWQSSHIHTFIGFGSVFIIIAFLKLKFLSLRKKKTNPIVIFETREDEMKYLIRMIQANMDLLDAQLLDCDTIYAIIMIFKRLQAIVIDSSSGRLRLNSNNIILVSEIIEKLSTMVSILQRSLHEASYSPIPSKLTAAHVNAIHFYDLIIIKCDIERMKHDYDIHLKDEALRASGYGAHDELRLAIEQNNIHAILNSAELCKAFQVTVEYDVDSIVDRLYEEEDMKYYEAYQRELQREVDATRYAIDELLYHTSQAYEEFSESSQRSSYDDSSKKFWLEDDSVPSSLSNSSKNQHDQLTPRNLFVDFILIENESSNMHKSEHHSFSCSMKSETSPRLSMESQILKAQSTVSIKTQQIVAITNLKADSRRRCNEIESTFQKQRDEIAQKRINRVNNSRDLAMQERRRREALAESKLIDLRALTNQIERGKDAMLAEATEIRHSLTRKLVVMKNQQRMLDRWLFILGCIYYPVIYFAAIYYFNSWSKQTDRGSIGLIPSLKHCLFHSCHHACNQICGFLEYESNVIHGHHDFHIRIEMVSNISMTDHDHNDHYVDNGRTIIPVINVFRNFVFYTNSYLFYVLSTKLPFNLNFSWMKSYPFINDMISNGLCAYRFVIHYVWLIGVLVFSHCLSYLRLLTVSEWLLTCGYIIAFGDILYMLCWSYPHLAIICICHGIGYFILSWFDNEVAWLWRRRNGCGKLISSTCMRKAIVYVINPLVFTALCIGMVSIQQSYGY